MKATKITVNYVILGDTAEAYRVMQALLDHGTLQDEINDWEGSGTPVRVASADLAHGEDVTRIYSQEIERFQGELAEVSP
jgi:hypothetical protein